MVILFIIALPFLLLALTFLELFLFGSKVDPDDNGFIRTPYQRSKYKRRKLKQREKKW